MSSAIATSVQGLNNAATRLVNAASNMVNASSTQNFLIATPQDSITLSASAANGGGDLAGDIVAEQTAKNDFAANAVAIKIESKLQKSLLDITA